MYFDESETVELNVIFREGTIMEFDLIPDGDVPYEDYVLRIAVRYSDKQYESDDEYDHDLYPPRIGYDFYNECKELLGEKYLTAYDLCGIKFIKCVINGYGAVGMFPIQPYEKITDYGGWFFNKITKHGVLDLSAWNILLYPEEHMS